MSISSERLRELTETKIGEGQSRYLFGKYWKELKHIHVELTGYFIGIIGRELDIIGKRDYSIFGYQVRALRKQLRADELKIFDRFYYERG